MQHSRVFFAPHEEVDFCGLVSTLNPNFPPHILSMGCGFDSLALLIEYATNPESRNFPLENLVVVHAVVGGESAQTKELMEEVFFPLCRSLNIWFIQAHRNGEFERDGITVLSSTRQPRIFYQRGDYSLFTYLITSGTVPQRGGSGRLCTLKFKGWVIDAIAQHLFGESPRQRYIGFNADESSRVKEQRPSQMQPYDYEIGFNADEAGRIKESADRRQVFRFPLIEMGHGRLWCEDRVNSFSAQWTQGEISQGKKSFCVNGCPFSECNGKKRQRGNNTHGDLRQDWLNEPCYGGEAAFLEHMALAMNVNQPLYTKQLVIDILKDTNNTAAIAHYERLLAGEFWTDLVVPRLQQLNTLSANAQADRLLAGDVWAVYKIRRENPCALCLGMRGEAMTK